MIVGSSGSSTAATPTFSRQMPRLRPELTPADSPPATFPRRFECPSVIPSGRWLISRSARNVPRRVRTRSSSRVSPASCCRRSCAPAEDAIRHQATHDPLTGLPNRTLFNDRLEHALVSTSASRWVRRGHGRRSRRIQERERQPRSPHRRRTADRSRRPIRCAPARLRHDRAPRRRRVRDPGRRPRRTRPGRTGRATRPRRARESVAASRPHRRHRREHRDRARRPSRHERPTDSSATPTPRCTARSEKARAATACSKPRCTPPRSSA